MKTILIATRNAHKVGEIRSILGGEVQYPTLNDFPGSPAVIEDAATFAGNAIKKAVQLALWLAAARSAALELLHRPPVSIKSDEPARKWDRLPACPSPTDPVPVKSGVSAPAAEHPAVASPETDLLYADLWVLADDSGLEVDALNGAPGVHSARFAAVDALQDGNTPDADNNAKLLRLLRDVPAETRTARFRCVLALTPVVSEPVASASPVCYAGEAPQTQIFDGACEGRIDFAPRGHGGFGYDPLFIPNGYKQSFAELGASVKDRISHRAQALGKLKQWLMV